MHQHPGDGSGECSDGDAGEQHGCDRGLSVARCDTIEQRGGRNAAAKGRQRQGVNAQKAEQWRQRGAAQHDDGDGAKARAGRDADNAGIGERIAEQALHHHARDRQARADQGAEDQPGQPDIVDDDVIADHHRVGAIGKAEPTRDHRPAGGPRCAGRKAEHGDHGEEDHEAGNRRPSEPRPVARAGCVWRRRPGFCCNIGHGYGCFAGSP
jgi:hypothetical protein